MAFLKEITRPFAENRRKQLFLFAPCLWLCGLFLLADIGLTLAQEPTAPEYKVKAAFLYNFAKLTDWPTNTFAATNTPLVIGVVGKNPFDGELEAVISGKTIAGHPVDIVRFAMAGEIKACQVVFIPRSENGRQPATLAWLAGQPILTVGDAPEFARHGGIIGLVKAGGEIHFQINPAAAERAGLKLSSKLLRLAEIIQPEPERKAD